MTVSKKQYVENDRRIFQESWIEKQTCVAYTRFVWTQYPRTNGGYLQRHQNTKHVGSYEQLTGSVGVGTQMIKLS
jgi:hypothetical protein